MTLERGGEIVLLFLLFYMNKGAPIYGASIYVILRNFKVRDLGMQKWWN